MLEHQPSSEQTFTPLLVYSIAHMICSNVYTLFLTKFNITMPNVDRSALFNDTSGSSVLPLTYSLSHNNNNNNNNNNKLYKTKNWLV